MNCCCRRLCGGLPLRLLRRRCGRWMKRSSLRRALIGKLAELGLMGIEVPEELGGSGGSFFEAILAVEALSAVDASVGLVVDIQNTLCVNSFCAGARRRSSSVAAEAGWRDDLLVCAERGGIGLGCVCDGDSAVRKTERPGTAFTGRKLWISNAREAGSFWSLRISIQRLDIAGLRRFSWRLEHAWLTVGRKEDKLGIRASSTCEVIS
jgi:alkylation response protein AidB-like acyl-CoA dehydrogenase